MNRSDGVSAGSPPSPPSRDYRKYYDLGSFCRPVTTSSVDAQEWFDCGLVWSYGFHHEEAVSCFQNAIANEPACAIAYWGLAYALGPNYNKPWEAFDPSDLGSTVERTHEAIFKAQLHSGPTSPVERALINALGFRYPRAQAAGTKEFSVWNEDYSEAMRLVFESFSDDLDVAALYADSLMNLMPWGLWDLRSGLPAPGARTLEVKTVLDRALAQPGGSDHPGLLHLYIHLMEMSSTPESALEASENLQGLIPDAGHLNHMPSHIHMLCGNYDRAIASNTEATNSDRKFLARSGNLNFYSLYRCHNYHFLIYAAMFAGQSKIALEAMDHCESSIPEELLRIQSPPMADWLESFISIRVHILIRFGLWEDILNLDFPQDRGLYCVTTAMIHYGRGIALAVKGNLAAADDERELFKAALNRVAPTRTLFNNTCIDILTIAAEMLDGELKYRESQFESAFEHLRRAIKLEDSLPYDEPNGWMQPTRHAFGALSLEQGRVDEAAAVYKADLGLDDTLPRAQRHPNNIWALHGYHECLVGLGRSVEAREIKLRLDIAENAADVPILSSCFCRLVTKNSPKAVIHGEAGCCP